MDDPIAHAESVIAKGEALDRRITDHTEQVIKELIAYKNEKTRSDRIRNGIIAVIIVMLFVGTFAVVKIRDNAASISQFCKATNKANAGMQEIFDFVLALPADPNETEQQRNTRIQFNDLVHKTLAPIDCSQQKVLP